MLQLRQNSVAGQHRRQSEWRGRASWRPASSAFPTRYKQSGNVYGGDSWADVSFAKDRRKRSGSNSAVSADPLKKQIDLEEVIVSQIVVGRKLQKRVGIL